MIACTSEKFRKAYGWQRDGGMAPYILAEEKDLVLLPDSLSYADGAQVRALTGGMGVERAVECSANDKGRLTAIQATRKWGKIVFIGEGGTVNFNPSPDIIHDQKTIYGSWVTSIWLMEEVVERIERWGIHPDRLITHRFPLEKASDAYALMAGGKCGKVAVCFDEELRKKRK